MSAKGRNRFLSSNWNWTIVFKFLHYKRAEATLNERKAPQSKPTLREEKGIIWAYTYSLARQHVQQSRSPLLTDTDIVDFVKDPTIR